MTEDQLQCAAYEYVRLAVPHALVWHTPNGGSRNKIEAAKLKRMGVTAGVPDLAIYTGRLYFVEIKVGRNRATETQEEFMSRVRSLGGDTAVCWSLDDVTLALKTWGLIR